jgi:hypothetical protein
MNGTYCLASIEHLATSNYTLVASEGALLACQIANERSSEGAGDAIEFGCAISPWNQVVSTNFELSKVQWDPMVDRFPLDLRGASGDARRWPLRNASDLTDLTDLQQVEVLYYTPSAAVIAKGLDLKEHFHHYLAYFCFRGQRGTNHFWLKVAMLMDGRILGAEGQKIPS